MIESTIITTQVLTSNSSPIVFDNDSFKTKSASCCGWLNHNEGSPLYKIIQGGVYDINVTISATSATAGIIAIGLYRDGILDNSTIASQTLTAAGDNTNLSINKKIKVCCNSNETIAVASVPSVLSGVDGETPTDTETPIILNGTISVTKIY